jgi:YD repeat-containing protein
LPPDICKTSVGNPIDVAAGNKYQIETDYIGGGEFPLSIVRKYNSSPLAASPGNTKLAAADGRSFGKRWLGNYDRTISTAGNEVVNAYRHDGTIVYFTLSSGTWNAEHGRKERLIEVKDLAGLRTGWTMVTLDDVTETYNKDGHLVGLKNRNGQKLTFQLSTSATPSTVAPGVNYLIKVTDHFGRALQLVWDSAGRLQTITAPDNVVFRYQYDSNGRLESVTYPGDEAGSRTYVYNEPEHNGGLDQPELLTGIIDEKGVRAATFEYDEKGRGVATEHAGGVERYAVTYGAGTTTVVDPFGSSRVYTLKNVLGSQRLAGQSQPAGAGCAAATKSLTYDSAGNTATEQDFRGVLTTYTYDGRGLELTRSISMTGAKTTKVTTEWHPTFRLKQRIAEPSLITSMTYDAGGNLLTLTRQATTDSTGQLGFDAVVSGTSRKWLYTYNSAGQLSTVTGPRTDAVDKTSYAYLSGNLQSVSDALGRKTTFDSYDGSGRATKTTAPNGSVTQYAYHPRGWLLSTTETAPGTSEQHVTSFTYEPTGKLSKVTWPDGTWLDYEYDDAQRLIAVVDTTGNRTAYTLDAMGNRTLEKTTDPSGNLSRQISRAYDALNRVQLQTGAAQ